MEGLLTENELTDTLMNFMKGASAPGIDGFTVNWLRQFWPELKLLVKLALNEMYDECNIIHHVLSCYYSSIKEG